VKTKRIVAVTILLGLAIFVLSGCGTQTSVVTSEPSQIIQTYGEAEVKAEPDLVRINLSIETRSDSAEKAVEENALLANAVIETLKSFGLTEKEIKTGSYQLYSYQEWFERKADEEAIITYHVTNEVLVSTSRIDEVGEIIDLAVKAGANNINHISFELVNPQELKMQALQAATRQAEQKAKAIAESAGEKISRLYRIREERTDYIPYVVRQDIAKEGMGMDTPTPIMPDEVVIRAAVSAEFTF